MSKKRALSGIKPTGFPHIGNYAGMLLPMLELSRDTKFDVNIFIADYHSLNDANARKNLGQLSLELAATLLALGFDPNGCTFYRQSDVPETFELTSFLTNFTPKGLMNRAHAYKAGWGKSWVSSIPFSNIDDRLCDLLQGLLSMETPTFYLTDNVRRDILKSLSEHRKNAGGATEAVFSGSKDGPLKRIIDPELKDQADQVIVNFEDADIGINMGLYNYPILMSADILLFDADVVPVGRDQRQHIEIARDIATAVNAFYGENVLKLPEGIISADTMELPGIDGRKMSKSYGNQLPIFAEPAEVEKIVKRIKTDSKTPDEAKDEGNLLLKFHMAMTTAEEHAAFRAKFLAPGMGYGEAKKAVMAAHEAKFGKAREEYKRLMADPAYVNSVLEMGAKKARDIAVPVLKRVRKAAGFN